MAPGHTSAVSVHVLLTVTLTLESFFALFKGTSTQVTGCSLETHPFLVGLTLALMLFDYT